jgi:hypothetical protein
VADPQRVVELAEAVADGRSIDWPSVESSAADAVERDVIAKLRVVHAIHGLMTTSTTRQSVDVGREVLSAGDQWGTLEIREYLGRGRFGDVYRAWDPALDREVALKLVRHVDRQDDTGTRVVSEGRLMARVRHPNVVTIHGAQRIDGVSGLWMELVDGRTLAAEIAERGACEAGELIRVGVELARALDAVHRAGLVHRDVKAQNVLREPGGRVVLGDFGTGLELDGPDEARGGLAGTPAYLAPEIFAHAPATPQSDLYSLGALLFHLATGQHAVAGRSVRELRDAHALGRRRSIDALRPDLPEALRRAIVRALDPDPAARFESGVQMASAIEHAAAPAGARSRLARMTAFAAVLAVGLGAGLYGVGRDEPSGVTGDPAAVAPSKLVLVTAFENHTGEPKLDGTLGPTLARGLSGAAAFGVVPAVRVEETLGLMRRPGTTRLDADIAHEVARRDGDVVAMVAGRIERMADAYVVRVDARAAGDDTRLASLASSPVPHGAIVDTVRRLALDLRGRLGASVPLPEPLDPRLPRVTTSSLRALELYAQMLAMRDGEGLLLGRESDAERLLRAAIGEDPDFAAACIWLAIVVRLDGERRGVSRLDEALVHAERAVALSSRVSRFERVRAEEQRHFVKFLMNPPEPEATVHAKALIAGCEELLQLRPDDPDVLIGCINFYQLTGTPNPDVAIRLAELRPSTARWQMAAAQAILEARPGDLERAREYVRRAARLHFKGTAQTLAVMRARLFAVGEIWLEGHPQEALRMSDDLRRVMMTLQEDERAAVASQLWPMYLSLGQLDRADEVLSAMTPWLTSWWRNAEVIVAEVREDRTALRTLLGRHFPRLEDGGGVSSAYLGAGLLDESRRLIAAHRRMEATRPGQFSQYLLMLDGNLALLEGRADDAVRCFEQFLTNHGSGLRGGRWLRVKRLLADALTARGDVAQAIIVLESVPSRPLGILLDTLGSKDWLQGRDRLAMLYRRSGRHREADAVEAELGTLLAVADDDHPIKRRLAAAAAATR